MASFNLRAVINQPPHFHRWEIGVDWKATDITVDVEVASIFIFKMFYYNRCAFIKPDDSVVQSFSSLSINCNNSFSLVGDGQTFHIFYSQLVSFTYDFNAFFDICINFFGIMFAPARMQRNLPVLSLLNINNFQIMINHENTGRCRPLFMEVDFLYYLPNQWWEYSVCCSIDSPFLFILIWIY